MTVLVVIGKRGGRDREKNRGNAWKGKSSIPANSCHETRLKRLGEYLGAAATAERCKKKKNNNNIERSERIQVVLSIIPMTPSIIVINLPTWTTLLGELDNNAASRVKTMNDVRRSLLT